MYTWTDPSRVWNATPSVVPGANNLLIAFTFINTGIGGAGAITMTLKNTVGTVLATKTVTLNPNDYDVLSWQGDMPNTTLSLVATATP